MTHTARQTGPTPAGDRDDPHADIGYSLATTLLALIESGRTTRAQLKHVGEIPRQTLREMMAREDSLEIQRCQRLIKHLPDPTARQLIARALVGRPLQLHHAMDDQTLDIDGDGRITREDAIDASMAAAELWLEVARVYRQALRDGKVTSEEATDFKLRLNELAQTLSTVQAIEAHCDDQDRKRADRRRCRPLKMAVSD